MKETAVAGPQPRTHPKGEYLRFLTDERLRQGIELMFFAARDLEADSEQTLVRSGLGWAHHRAMHFIAAQPGISVNELLERLAVTRQSLSPVLGKLVAARLVTKRICGTDRRRRSLELTPAGIAIEQALSVGKRRRMRRAYRAAGAEAVDGFRTVLEQLIEESDRQRILASLYGDS